MRSTRMFGDAANTEHPSDSDSPEVNNEFIEQFDQMALELRPEQPKPIPPACSNPDCPISQAHPAGLYQYNSQPWSFQDINAETFARDTFGASNPPPSVWESLTRLANGQGLHADALAVHAFQEAHYV